MAVSHLNRLKCAVSGTPGVGAVTVGAAVAGYRAPGAAQDGKNFTMTLVEGSSWEVFSSVYTSSTTSFSRGALLDSSTGSQISFTSAATIEETIESDFMNRMEMSASAHVMSVNGNGASNQALSSYVSTKIAAALNSAATVDTDGWWSSVNKRCTPTIPGKYLVVGQIKGLVLAVDTLVIAQIYKNGVDIADGGRAYNRLSNNDIESGQLVTVVSCNGSTDYIELYGIISGNYNVGAALGTYLNVIYLGA